MQVCKTYVYMGKAEVSKGNRDVEMGKANMERGKKKIEPGQNNMGFYALDT